MLVRFWGVRGSTPTPQQENLRYGGNTSCVEVRVNGNLYVFDCGTGFRNLGKQLAQENNGSPVSGHIFLSHFHWDHIQGIPFFAPLYGNRESSFVFHSSSRTRGLQRAIEAQMSDPYFPVNMNEMAARRQFSNIDEGRTELDHGSIQSMWLNHPQGCLGFRLEAGGKVLVYATDNEPGADDLLVAERRYPHRVGQTYRLKYSPGHRWYYFPRMRRDEAIVFKVFDSEKDGRARFTPHTSFDDPSTPPGAPPRQSVEARALAFF